MVSANSRTTTTTAETRGGATRFSCRTRKRTSLPIELADLDEDEQHDDRQHRGQRVVPESQPRHAHQVADVVLPDVEPDDHQHHGRSTPTTTSSQPRPARCGRAGVLRPHVAHQPDRENADAVADRAGRAADQSLEQRAAGQQRRRQRQPQEHQADRGAGERVVAKPPGRLPAAGGVSCLRWCVLSVAAAGVVSRRQLSGA